MTNIIRLDESINDYAARPVITRLGEPDLAIRPSTYLDELGESTSIDPSQILIDGSHGQTVNPAPFTGVREGAMTIKSDVDGVYLAMPQIGIRTDIVMDTRNDRGTLAIIKYRLNDIFEGATRLISAGSGSGSTANFRLTTDFETKRVRGVGGFSHQLDNLVHTVAVYRGPEGYYVFEGDKKYISSSSASIPNDLTGVGINTSSITDPEPNDLDLYGLELYLDVELTEQQIIDYLKTF